MRVAGFWSRGVIGPYTFENAAGNTITLNGERYRAIISDFLGPYLEELEMDLNMVTLSLQQDGTTCHTYKDAIPHLRKKFRPRFCPPRSCAT